MVILSDKQRFRIVFVAAISLVSGCTQAALLQQEALFGGLLGGGAGAGIGGIVADDDDYMKSETIALGAGVGAAAGILAGGLLYDSRKAEAMKLRPIRKPILEDQLDTWSLDEAYEQVQESTKQGQGEVVPWNERYWDESPNIPYLGPQL